MPRPLTPELTDADVARLRARLEKHSGKPTFESKEYPRVTVVLDGGPLDGMTIYVMATNADEGGWFILPTRDGLVELHYVAEIPGVWRYELVQWIKGTPDYAAMAPVTGHCVQPIAARKTWSQNATKKNANWGSEKTRLSYS